MLLLDPCGVHQGGLQGAAPLRQEGEAHPDVEPPVPLQHQAGDTAAEPGPDERQHEQAAVDPLHSSPAISRVESEQEITFCWIKHNLHQDVARCSHRRPSQGKGKGN
jgi:hypothetical protein